MMIHSGQNQQFVLTLGDPGSATLKLKLNPMLLRYGWNLAQRLILQPTLELLYLFEVCKDHLYFE
jgi:uncharacterized protein involved in copper resistance